VRGKKMPLRTALARHRLRRHAAYIILMEKLQEGTVKKPSVLFSPAAKTGRVDTPQKAVSGEFP